MYIDLGPCIRSIDLPANQRSIFLTFDDGPDPKLTPAILDLLTKYRAKATFFVVGTKAIENKAVVRRMVDEGHAIGNHSYDHKYNAFFSGSKSMNAWLAKSEDVISQVSGVRSVGFRSPAGIQTPHLFSGLREVKLPLILWNRRYFDTILPWSDRRARAAGQSLQPGDIILLHDRSSWASGSTLLKSLESFLQVVHFQSIPSIALSYEYVKLT